MFNHLIILLSLFSPFAGAFANANWIDNYVKNIPDFPIQGIQFKWYGSLLKDPAAFKKVIKLFADRYRDQSIDAIVALDSRGFIFGTALGYELDLPIVLVRKAGKLPGEVNTRSYDLEYGKSTFEIERNSLNPGQRVIIIDDVIATGGTVCAAGLLVESLGAEVAEVACLIELYALEARNRIPYPLFTLMGIP